MTTRYTDDIPLETLPESWQRHIQKLRRECSQARIRRNEARDALVSVITERDAARAELAELKAARTDG
ncbi:hypothetical protein MPRI_22990 [Mycobacterium paraintracellulare]|uniref:Antitoxin n=1 Tax=Mycobacterium paraintracellulare TaxID=1138383 RepID=A0ABN6ATA8_9MYCO|nr:hypothetical protein B8W68_25240 [Mycobacterium paraintracellulare]BBY70112.1 hypothetical protein MPRI_22990 [Mycobacterium paraintracellulare]